MNSDILKADIIWSRGKIVWTRRERERERGRKGERKRWKVGGRYDGKRWLTLRWAPVLLVPILSFLS